MKTCFWMKRQCEIPTCLKMKMKTGTCQNYSRTWQCDWANLNQKVASCFKETANWSILGYCRVAIKKNIWFDCNGLEGVRNPFPELKLNWQYIIKGFCGTWIDSVFFILYLSFCIYRYVKTSFFRFQGCSEEMRHKLHGIGLAFWQLRCTCSEEIIHHLSQIDKYIYSFIQLIQSWKSINSLFANTLA